MLKFHMHNARRGTFGSPAARNISSARATGGPQSITRDLPPNAVAVPREAVLVTRAIDPRSAVSTDASVGVGRGDTAIPYFAITHATHGPGGAVVMPPRSEAQTARILAGFAAGNAAVSGGAIIPPAKADKKRELGQPKANGEQPSGR